MTDHSRFATVEHTMTTPYIEQIVERAMSLKRDFAIAAGAADLKNARRWADALTKGRIFFYEQQEVDIGLSGVDWSGSHVAHQEWPAQLNRFFWLPHLAAVYEDTGDEEMPRLARATIEDWINQHEYGAERPLAKGDNTLNLSIRLGQSVFGGWWGTLPAFARSAHYDEPFVRRMAASTLGQLDYLATHLAPIGNWRISHLDCLLYCSQIVPGANRHQTFAVQRLNEAFHRQIDDDGSHEEHNPSYHGWMCRLFTNLWRLNRARPELGLRIDTERAARMWDYAVCSAAPDGRSAGLHDAAAWCAGLPEGGQSPAKPPSSASAGLMRERRGFLKAAGLSRKRGWSLDRQPSRWFPCAGQLFLRDSWKPDATFIAFDATRWGGGHCHLSRLGVNLYAGGRMLLNDPGSFTYEMSDPFAAYGKSTPAHNTVTVGGASQSETDPDTRAVHVGERVALIASGYGGGYHDGRYTWWWENGHGNATFGTHDRVLVWLKGHAALVFDLVITNGGQPLAAHWQLPRGPVTVDPARARAWTGGPGSNILVQRIGGNCEPALVIHEGEKEPLLGWLPGGHDSSLNGSRPGPHSYEPAPLLAMETRAEGQHTELATLLMPFRGDAPPSVEINPFPRLRGGAYGFRFGWPDGTEDLVFCTPALRTAIDAAGPVWSDGSLAVISRAQARVTSAFLFGGMVLELDGRRLFDEPDCGPHERVWDSAAGQAG